MATYLVDACLPKLELFAGKGSKNSGISLTGPNSHKNRIRVEIGAKNKQTEVERREKRSPTRLHAPARALEGVLRTAFYVLLSVQSRVETGRFGQVRAVSGSSVRTRADLVAHA